MADEHKNEIEPMVRLELLGSEWEWLLDHMEVLHRRTQEIDTAMDSVRSGRLIGTLVVQLARHKAELWTNESRPTRKFLNEECR